MLASLAHLIPKDMFFIATQHLQILITCIYFLNLIIIYNLFIYLSNPYVELAMYSLAFGLSLLLR